MDRSSGVEGPARSAGNDKDSEQAADAPWDLEDTGGSALTSLVYERSYQQVARLAAQYEALLRTRTFRYLQPFRSLYSALRAGGRRPADSNGTTRALAELPPLLADEEYRLWIRCFDTIDDLVRLDLADRLAELDQHPLVSVVLPVHDTPEPYLDHVITSVRKQLYENWELCICDDASTAPHVARILDAAAAADERVKVVRRTENGHICAASNNALAIATGEWVAFLDHDDALAEHALAVVVLALAGAHDPAVLYSDEDKLDTSGLRHQPYFKPEFDRLLLMGQNYLTHFLVARRDLVAKVGGLRPGYEGSQDWDLALRITEGLRDDQILHLPHVLYHWRAHERSTASQVEAKPYALAAGERAVQEHLARTGRAGTVVQLPSGHHRLAWDLPEPAPLVSVVVPTRDGQLLARCIDSLLGRTDFPRLEVLVIDNGSSDPDVLEYLRSRQGEITVIRDDRPFNYSALNNAAAAQASGEVLCLLNDDTEVVAGNWLTEMVGQLFQPDVGAVGAKLYYDEGTIQHAGVVLGVGGVAGHAYRRAPASSTGQMGRLLLAQTMSAVTGACMAVRRQAWEDVGGLEEDHLAVAFNDVDFCLRLREAGWHVVWTPAAELLHHESVSRGSETKRRAAFAAEERYMRWRWGEALRHDPAYNPNLTLVSEDFSLAWPPRVSYR